MSDTEIKHCPHVTLVRQNVGNFHWHKCVACETKFKAIEWDGKVTVIPAATPQVTPTNTGNLCYCGNPMNWSASSGCYYPHVGCKQKSEGTSEQAPPQVQICTRLLPHVCGEYGPCNGFPRTKGTK